MRSLICVIVSLVYVLVPEFLLSAQDENGGACPSAVVWSIEDDSLFDWPEDNLKFSNFTEITVEAHSGKLKFRFDLVDDFQKLGWRSNPDVSDPKIEMASINIRTPYHSPPREISLDLSNRAAGNSQSQYDVVVILFFDSSNDFISEGFYQVDVNNFATRQANYKSGRFTINSDEVILELPYTDLKVGQGSELTIQVLEPLRNPTRMNYSDPKCLKLDF